MSARMAMLRPPAPSVSRTTTPWPPMSRVTRSPRPPADPRHRRRSPVPGKRVLAGVEFFGPGVSTLSAGDRAVVANMAPLSTGLRLAFSQSIPIQPPISKRRGEAMNSRPRAAGGAGTPREWRLGGVHAVHAGAGKRRRAVRAAASEAPAAIPRQGRFHPRKMGPRPSG